MRSLVHTAPALAIAVLSACADTNPASPVRPEPLPPLTPALWHVHAADGRALPALITERVESGSTVQEFLDSARVQVNTGGTWTRTLWMSRFRAERYETKLTSQESGTWVVTDTGYLFRSVPSGRSFVVARAVPGDSIVLPLRSVADGGAIEATLRTIPPAVSIFGEYRVTDVRGRAVPAPIYWETEQQVGDRLVSIHLVVDSATLRLNPDGVYQQAIFYKKMEGPAGGEPTTVRGEFVIYDVGAFTREDRLIRFESALRPNYRFAGTVYNANAMELLHGLTQEDAPVPVRYARP